MAIVVGLKQHGHWCWYEPEGVVAAVATSLARFATFTMGDSARVVAHAHVGGSVVMTVGTAGGR